MFGWLFKKSSPVVLIAPPKAEIPDAKLPTLNEQMVHLGVIVGHSQKDGGAVLAHPSKLNEYQYGKRVAEAIEYKAKGYYPKIKVSVLLRDDIGISGAYDRARGLGCDCVVELHFNAHNGKASGSLTLCTPDGGDVEFAHILHKFICKTFNRVGSSMGVAVIGRSVRGAGNVYAFPEGVNCLLEPFFGDSEAELGISKLDEYAEAILGGVTQWATKLDLISWQKP
jgi:N-acetylmuramoyl-L-alanine amidase